METAMQSLLINMHHFPTNTILDRAYAPAIACKQMTQAPKLESKSEACKERIPQLHYNHLMYY